MDQNFKTGMAALGRFIEEKGLLVCLKNGTYIPLKFSSITVELSQEWTAMQAERGIKEKKKKKGNSK